MDYQGIGLIITALGVVLVNVLTWSSNRRIASVEAETKEIKHQTNAINTALQAALDKANEKNLSYERLMAQMEESKREAATTKIATDLAAAQLKQTVVTIDRTTAEIAAGVNHLNGMDEPSDSVRQIERHTAETAKNTARTEAGVQELKDKA